MPGEDFPATLAVLGADNFAALVKEYLLEHPPTEPSILYAGLYLADFLNDHPFAERWPFIADLARLERAVLDVSPPSSPPPLPPPPPSPSPPLSPFSPLPPPSPPSPPLHAADAPY